MSPKKVKMFCYLGLCSCGKVKVELLLPHELSGYAPRACDCAFCTIHDVAYLSDPDGQFTITCEYPPKMAQQGSNQASFLMCASCGDVLCATYSFDNKLKGALNVKVLNDFPHLAKAQVVSPRQLSPQQKVARWKRLWSTVYIT